jgi:tetratricopeptide (TPR) repeat protein
MEFRDALDQQFARLCALAKADQRNAVFGAAGHQWSVCEVEAAELEAVEAVAGRLPEDWRLWISEVAGTGAGPFYGVLPLPNTDDPAHLGRPFFPETPEGEPVPGCLPLTDHGCGYQDLLVLNGPHRGEVWVDFREAEGPVVHWYRSTEAWFGAWLTYGEAEWGISYLVDGSADEDTLEAFLAQVARSLDAVANDTDDPILAQYPLALDKVHQARARLALKAGDVAAAEAAFAAAVAVSREAEAVHALGRCAIAEHTGDHEAWLAAAVAGLGIRNLYWSQKKFLLGEHAKALEALARWDEALVAREALSKHDPQSAPKTHPVS